jgi:hypothetical protein
MRIRQARKIMNRQIENDFDELSYECVIYSPAKLTKAYRTWKTRQDRKEIRKLKKLLHKAWIWQVERIRNVRKKSQGETESE